MGRAYLIASGKGGVGKSTVASSLALALKARGVSTVLFDGDVGLRCADLMLNMQDQVVFDLEDILSGAVSIENALYPVGGPNSCLSLLATSQTLRAGEVRAKDVRKVAEKLKARFDVVIIDGPAGIGRNLKLLTGAADDVILVCNSDPVSVRDTEKTAEVLRDLHAHPYLIVNRLVKKEVLRGRATPPKALAESMDLRLLGMVRESLLVPRALLDNKSAYEAGDAAVKSAFDRIASRLMGEDVPLPRAEKSAVMSFFTGRRL